MDSLIGVCMECGEWTTVKESCCGAGVACEGHIYHDDEEDE